MHAYNPTAQQRIGFYDCIFGMSANVHVRAENLTQRPSKYLASIHVI